MDTKTNHLVDITQHTEDELATLGTLGYEPVPDDLAVQAQLELMGKKSTFVGKNSSGSLAKHMRYTRKKKRLMAKAVRRQKRFHCG